MGMDKDSAIEKVRQVALEAGYTETRLSSTSDRLVIPVRLQDTRMQYVFIHFQEDFATACTSRHDVIATVFSTCLKLNEDDLQLERPTLSWVLLQENSKIPFGRYAVVSTAEEDEYAIIVSCDHIIDTLDPPELIAMVEYIAQIADGFEETHNLGADDY
jgi:hypothetical protein